MYKPKRQVARTCGFVDKVPFGVIASDQRERGNLILRAAQRIEIATVRPPRRIPRNDGSVGFVNTPMCACSKRDNWRLMVVLLASFKIPIAKSIVIVTLRCMYKKQMWTSTVHVKKYWILAFARITQGNLFHVLRASVA